ncbi:DNA replication/repair protein RecF [Maritimibacter dapengensis]|uniref:DNA replication and repair protein RecF n=1 Tax=Maritimibacter dapengensis TaxID=2836868 RepID=A0ABS6T3L9_9RHOB|nr:DNA replication/repair protein RecF [Maritimibacter dapengensis]MBV7379849.1 DNA replication/repair protein RecF [Maritimibacter dapengensis]
MTGLYLKSLTLSHFRSHRRAELTLDGRPVAIFGANGAGKTNILEAVSLMSPGRGLRGAAAEDMGRKPEGVGWKLSGVLQSLHQVHEVVTWAEPGASRQVTIDDKAAAQVALGRIARMTWLVPVMDRLWIEGADGRRKFLDRLAMSFEPNHAQAVLTYEKAMRERNRLLKDQQRDAHWYAALEAQMAKAGGDIQANRARTVALIIGAQMQAETAFPAAELQLLHAEGAADGPEGEEALADAFAESRPRDLMAGRTLVGPHRADLAAVYAEKGMPAKECSTGEQKALLVSLILAHGRALSQDFGAPPMLLLDEVSAHLDADRRAALYDEIVALGAQAFMTGTGPELFTELGDRAMHIHVSEDAGQSRIEEVDP